VVCFTCGEVSVYPNGKIPINLIVQKMVKQMRTPVPAPAPVHVSGPINTEPICKLHCLPLHIFCKECQKLMCPTCSILNRCKDHTFISREEGISHIQRTADELLTTRRVEFEERMMSRNRTIIEAERDISIQICELQTTLNRLIEYRDSTISPHCRKVEDASVNVNRLFLSERKTYDINGLQVPKEWLKAIRINIDMTLDKIEYEVKLPTELECLTKWSRCRTWVFKSENAPRITSSRRTLGTSVFITGETFVLLEGMYESMQGYGCPTRRWVSVNNVYPVDRCVSPHDIPTGNQCNGSSYGYIHDNDSVEWDFVDDQKSLYRITTGRELVVFTSDMGRKSVHSNSNRADGRHVVICKDVDAAVPLISKDLLLESIMVLSGGYLMKFVRQSGPGRFECISKWDIPQDLSVDKDTGLVYLPLLNSIKCSGYMFSLDSEEFTKTHPDRNTLPIDDQLTVQLFDTGVIEISHSSGYIVYKEKVVDAFDKGRCYLNVNQSIVIECIKRHDTGREYRDIHTVVHEM
jgi:hypothetical protein